MKSFTQSIFSLATLWFVVGLFTISACTSPDESSSQNQTTGSQQAQKPMADQTVNYAKGAPAANSGIVKQVHQAGGYSYIDTDVNGSRYWIASGMVPLKANDRIYWNDYALMNNFQSKALGKSFDQILFVDRVRTDSAQSAQPAANSGQVMDSITSAGYTYIQVKQHNSDVWIAAPTTKVSKGQIISWSGGSTMHNFTSRSLNRTFNQILFVGGIKINQG